MGNALEIAAAVRDGRRTAREVIDEALARIATRDPHIGAFQVVDVNGARRAADELTGWADPAGLPLAGVPVAIKDNVDVAGLPTRHGSGATPETPAPADDELVRRLRTAGAIVVGKTKLPELAIWGFTESLAHGGTRNPRNPARNTGGSTGGGAAAVAAGMVPLALGSDGGGSLRIPAANCGVVGFKTARGMLPLPGGAADHWYGNSVSGVIAADLEDTLLGLDILRGDATWRDESTVDGPLRVAVSVRPPAPVGVPSPVKNAVRAAAGLARTAGHSVVRADPPYPMTLAFSWTDCWYAGIAEEVEQKGLAVAGLEPRTRGMVARGQRLRRAGKPDGRAAEAWRRTATAWFERFDVLITPAIARPAPAFGWGAKAGYWRSYLNGARATPFTQAWNLAGYPAVSLPLDGTPTEPASVQLVTVPGREAALIALARALTRL